MVEEAADPDSLDPREMPWGSFELSTHLLANAAASLGFRPTWLSPAMFVVNVGGREPLGFNMTRCNVTSTVGFRMTSRKDLTRRMVGAAGLAVAAGQVVSRPDEVEVEPPLVVKPLAGGKGRGISVGVTYEQLPEALSLAGTPALVEQVFEGSEARFLTVDGKCLAVVARRRPMVVGDGASTVSALIRRKNRERRQNPHLGKRPIRLDDWRREFIASQGFEIEDVLPRGVELVIDLKASFSGGGESADITDEVHPSFLQVAADAQTALPGLGLSGVDIIAKDFSRPAAPDSYIICEINSRPAIGSHHFPWIGQPRDVAMPIVNLCLDRIQQTQLRRRRSRRMARP